MLLKHCIYMGGSHGNRKVAVGAELEIPGMEAGHFNRVAHELRVLILSA